MEGQHQEKDKRKGTEKVNEFWKEEKTRQKQNLGCDRS